MKELSLPFERASTVTKIPARTWAVMILLGLSGQIAWGIENTWFNTFVYDELTPDPRPVAWMVAASAITATLTTILMGTLSDRTRSRWGRRKPFILAGYILWGLATALFPTVALIQATGMAIFMVVVADSVMTFFGSTANDAAFNAWTTDVSDTTNRGRVESVLQITVFAANIVAFALAGLVIEALGYFFFFYVLGGIVILAGIIAGGLLREPPIAEVELARERPPFWREVLEAFRWETVRQNRVLFLLFVFILISSAANEISFPYLIVYFENFLGYSKSQFSLLAAGILLANVALAIPIGVQADRRDRRKMLIGITLVWTLATFLFSLARSLPAIIAVSLVVQPMSMAIAIVSVAWLKDLIPEESRGRFLGLRMIFWIAVPMVIGPGIGSTLIRAFGQPVVMNGEAGFIPPPHIWWATALVGLLALLPLAWIGRMGRSR